MSQHVDASTPPRPSPIWMAGVTTGGTTKNSDDDLVGVGSHKGPLVDLLEALANPCHEVQRLLAMADD